MLASAIILGGTSYLMFSQSDATGSRAYHYAGVVFGFLAVTTVLVNAVTVLGGLV